MVMGHSEATPGEYNKMKAKSAHGVAVILMFLPHLVRITANISELYTLLRCLVHG